MRILIAEDDIASRRLLESLLAKWQYEVVSCIDGDQAWEILARDDAPSLVILDWMMPGLDGIEVCRRVRAARASHLTYIIMLTAIDTRDDVIEALRVGADDFLCKPFNRDELRVRLQVGQRILGLQENLVQQERAARSRAETLVAERTIELSEANQKLKEQQAQLVHAEKMGAIGQLAAGIAHEINNPVSYITNNVDSLKEYIEIFAELIAHYETLQKQVEGAAEQEQIEESLAVVRQFSARENISFILSDTTQLIIDTQKGVVRVRDIVQGLKNFAHPNSGEPQEADINEGIESVINMAWNEIKYKAKLDKNLGELPPLTCHLGELNQVFLNLLINAGQAIEDNGRIGVDSQFCDGEIIVCISDTGNGIPQEKISRIFEPFYTTKEVGQGTGLGLAISYGIIEKHGGRIEVDSKEGEYTRFIVHLPVVRDEE